MKLLQENDGFSPISIVLETREEAHVFWNMIQCIKKTTTQGAEYEMAKTISAWLFTNAKS
jgi:hypothetical protein